MAKIFAITNQKGGVGKTTTCAALGTAWAEAGDKVLLVDCDPQAGATLSLGFDPDTLQKTIYQALIGEITPEDALLHTKIPNMDLIPANIHLSAVERELKEELGWESTLKDALEAISARYTRVLLDCPPSLGVLTTNALVAAQIAIVPLQTEYLAMRGLKQVQYIVDKVRKKANPTLEIRILRTMYDPRTLHAREVSEEIEKVFGEKVFRPIIKRSIRFADATLAGESILTYARESEMAEAYRELAKEI